MQIIAISRRREAQYYSRNIVAEVLFQKYYSTVTIASEGKSTALVPEHGLLIGSMPVQIIGFVFFKPKQCQRLFQKGTIKSTTMLALRMLF